LLSLEILLRLEWLSVKSHDLLFLEILLGHATCPFIFGIIVEEISLKISRYHSLNEENYPEEISLEGFKVPSSK
jgi:hypothetical protein